MREKSAGVIIFRREAGGNRFLLLNYPSGHWDFVKGKIEAGESTRQTASRETREETGITDIVFLDGFEEWIRYNFQFHDQVIHKRVVFFLARTGTKKIRLSDEHDDYTWLDYDGAMQKATFENARSVLKKANTLLKTLE